MNFTLNESVFLFKYSPTLSVWWMSKPEHTNSLKGRSRNSDLVSKGIDLSARGNMLQLFQHYDGKNKLTVNQST